MQFIWIVCVVFLVAALIAFAVVLPLVNRTGKPMKIKATLTDKYVPSFEKSGPLPKRAKSPNRQEVTEYYAAFTLSDGDNRVFQLTEEQYNVLTVGRTGLLVFVGESFVSFEEDAT